MFFDELQKQKRTKKQPLLLKAFKEKKLVNSLTPLEEGLNTHFLYNYQVFPTFKPSMFYSPRQVESYNDDGGSLLKALISNEQLSKMND